MSRWSGLLDTLREQRWLQTHRHIHPEDFVLDIGSGGNPDLRANVLCDKFLVDGAERHHSRLVIDRPFVAGDVERLPFRDRAFDYVILSHVLEHLRQPELALAELQRVARRGYLETPSAEFERVHGHPFHRWLVSEQDGVLRLRPKSGPDPTPELRAWFQTTLQALGRERQFWSHRRRLGVYTSLEWEAPLRFRVETADAVSLGDLDQQFVEAAVGRQEPQIRTAEDGGLLWKLQGAWSRHQRRHSDRPWREIERLLCCPACRAGLQSSGDLRLQCEGCGAAYPIHRHGIPLLLEESRLDLPAMASHRPELVR